MSDIPQTIRTAYDIPNTSTITQLGGGNINGTYKVTHDDGKCFVLQSVNTDVFKYPDRIDQNLRSISVFLREQHPDYFFPGPLPSRDGKSMVHDDTGVPWRLLPFVENSECHNTAPTLTHARNAATGFARLTKLVSDIPLAQFADAFPQFHNLTLREAQLTEAIEQASDERKANANDTIDGFARFAYIGQKYREVISTGVLKKRIQHHDTKLNNILFRKGTSDVLAVIDLDLIMPGYFFSDIGELIMWGTSVFENETNLSNVVVNDAYYDAILEGYRVEMGDTLSDDEQTLIPFAPLVMCYMLGIRFLADYLNGEVYFKTQYAGQNLDKSRNRLKLLGELAQRGS